MSFLPKLAEVEEQLTRFFMHCVLIFVSIAPKTTLISEITLYDKTITDLT